MILWGRAWGENLYAKPRIFATPRRATEPMSVQVFSPELAVQALDERLVGRLAGPAEVERDAAHEGQ